MINFLKKIYRFLKPAYIWLFYQKRYGFGCCKSVIGKPLCLGNPSYIYIYRNCSIMPLARLEAVGIYDGHKYDGKLIIKENVDIG